MMSIVVIELVTGIRRVQGPARYLVVIERAEKNYSASVPDLLGCVSTGATKEETLRNIREAIAMHLEGLKEDGLPVPVPATSAEYLAV